MTNIVAFVLSHLAALRANEERGASAVEYGLVVTLIAIAILVGAGLLGTNLNDTFNDVAGKLPGVVP